MSAFEISYFLAVTLLLLWLIGKYSLFESELLKQKELRIYFLIKLGIGIGLTLLYEFYYGNRAFSDTFKFFDDALVVYQSFSSDPLTYFKIILGLDMENPNVMAIVDQMENWFKMYKRGMFNDNQTIIRFNSLVLLISFGNYYVHLAILNFISAIGLVKLLQFFELNGLKNKWVALLMLGFPQLIFWSSGLLKEGLLFAVFGWLLYFFHQSIKFPTFKNIGFFIFFLYLSMLIKSYVLLSLIIPFIFLLIRTRFKHVHSIVVSLCLCAFSFVLLYFLDGLLDLGIPNRIFQKQHDFVNVAYLSNARSYFESFTLEPTWWSLFLNAPEAFWNTLSRPYIWDSGNILALGAAFENIFLFAWIILMVIFPKPEFFKGEVFYFGVLFVVILFVTVGWATPIAGALVRYKIPAIPFVLFILYKGTNWMVLKRKLAL